MEATSRPHGPLLWVHAAASTSTASATALVERVGRERSDITILLTADTEPAPASGHFVFAGLPTSSSRKSAAAFVKHWRPDVLVWLGDPLRPALLAEAYRAGCRIIGADLTSARSGFVGLGVAHLAHLFERILIRSASEVEMLRRSSRRASVFELSSPLREAPAPPFCDHADLDIAAAMTAGRQIWLANDVTPGEIDLIAAAHTDAARLSHRLLTVLAPAPEVDVARTVARLEAAGLRVVLRSEADEIAEADQVLVADVEGEEGLWFRLAPMTFLGRSLVPPGGGSDPWPSASLGSAILHGPLVQARKADFDRLRRAAAARQVNSAEDLGAAVGELQSPERAAALAHAAWRVASEGAEVTDRIIELALDALDRAD